MESILKINTLEEQMKEVNKKLDGLDQQIETGFREIKEELKCYVRKEEFQTVKSIVYGMVGAILTGFLGTVIYIVMNKGL
jgi:hypothetical protein